MTNPAVMAGHSRSKNGVASLAYVPAISIEVALQCQVYRDHRVKPGGDDSHIPSHLPHPEVGQDR